MAPHAGDIVSRGTPLCFSSQLCLCQKIERRTLPTGVTEAAIIRIWSKAVTLGFTCQKRAMDEENFNSISATAVHQNASTPWPP